MSTNSNIPEVESPIPSNAVSVYGQNDAMDDFPVLKAFQQYVDAEHAKAQKRMTTLCIFFVVLMVAVIGMFIILLVNVSQRNNALSDQLFQYMLKDRDRQNVIVQSPGASQNDAAMKAMTDSMAAMQRQMIDQQSRLAEQQMKMAEEAMKSVAAKTAAAMETPVTESERAEFTKQRKQVRSESERLRRARAALDAERAKLAKEREWLKQKEIELHRRKLYPEAYAEAGAGAATPPAAQQPEEEEDDLSELDAAINAEERMLQEREDGSIRYFDDAEEGSAQDGAAPAPGAEGAAEWDVPME